MKKKFVRGVYKPIYIYYITTITRSLKAAHHQRPNVKGRYAPAAEPVKACEGGSVKGCVSLK